MQCVAVCCSVLHYVAVCCSVFSVLQCVQCVAVCCSVLQRVAACCSVLQCVADDNARNHVALQQEGARGGQAKMLQCVAVC